MAISYAINRTTVAWSAVVSDFPADSTKGETAGRGTAGVVASDGEMDFATARGLARIRFCVFFRVFLRDRGSAAACNSRKLNLIKDSKRRRSGAACTSPLNPKYMVPL